MFYVILYILSINFMTYLIYRSDKHAAINRMWRISEGSLLTFAFIGGSPAALCAMYSLRHKIRKNSFMDKFYMLVAIQIIVIGAWFSGIIEFIITS